MRRELCLQSRLKLSGSKLLEQLQLQEQFIVSQPRRFKTKHKIILRGEEFVAIRQFSCLHLHPKHKKAICELRIEEGALMAGGTLLQQCDVIITYYSRNRAAVTKFLEKLFELGAFIIVEPNVFERLKQQQGCFNPLSLTTYKAKDIQAGLMSHLPWQISVVNQALENFSHNTLDRPALRQLRVKLRRLRSCLTFFKPALKNVEAQEWQEWLRRMGEELSLMRELDVALMAIERIKLNALEQDTQYPAALEEALLNSRTAEASSLQAKLDLPHLTLRLAKFLVWLQGQPINPNYAQTKLKTFLRQRAKEWTEGVLRLQDKYPDFTDMVALHKIRIKVKRFRYVLMCLPEINKNTNGLLRRLKRLQDTLGFLHDDFINAQLVETLAGAKAKELTYEIALFTGWERAKADATLELVPDLWEEFCEELTIWQKEYL